MQVHFNKTKSNIELYNGSRTPQYHIGGRNFKFELLVRTLLRQFTVNIFIDKSYPDLQDMTLIKVIFSKQNFASITVYIFTHIVLQEACFGCVNRSKKLIDTPEIQRTRPVQTFLDGVQQQVNQSPTTTNGPTK